MLPNSLPLWITLAQFLALAAVLAALEDLVIVGLAPFDGDIGPGIKPAVDLALKDVNSHSAYLSGYNLSVHWVDTKVSIFVFFCFFVFILFIWPSLNNSIHV